MKNYELHIIEENGGGEIMEIYSSSAAQAIRSYARDMGMGFEDLITTEADGRSLEVIVTDKNVALVYAEAQVGGKLVQAAVEVEDLRDRK